MSKKREVVIRALRKRKKFFYNDKMIDEVAEGDCPCTCPILLSRGDCQMSCGQIHDALDRKGKVGYDYSENYCAGFILWFRKTLLNKERAHIKI
jgi:hypothetical protein